MIIVGGGHPLGWDAAQHLRSKLTCKHQNTDNRSTKTRSRIYLCECTYLLTQESGFLSFFSPLVHIITFTFLILSYIRQLSLIDSFITISNLGMDLDDVEVGASSERASNVVSSLTLVVGMSSSCIHCNIL